MGHGSGQLSWPPSAVLTATGESLKGLSEIGSVASVVGESVLALEIRALLLLLDLATPSAQGTYLGKVLRILPPP